MEIAKQRVYKYDNVKALLIFLVVVGHMTTDYVSDSSLVRWTTLWIYLFHMPAFIFISGLVHKQYITDEQKALGIRGETSLRLDKALGLFFCGYTLKVVIQITRTLLGQNPNWNWISEPGIPWYLFVMAEYELLFFAMRRIGSKIKPMTMIAGSFLVSAFIGYIPMGDVFSLSRMINFLPIYMMGYYLDMRAFLQMIEKVRYKIFSVFVIVSSVFICRFGSWDMYHWRKWFTGRRSYYFLSDYFSYSLSLGPVIRILVWIIAIAISLSIIVIMPNKNLGYITKIGSRTLNVYFWHRPVCYLLCSLGLLPKLVELFNGTYYIAYGIYLFVALAMTAFFSLKIFEHPCKDLMCLASRITNNLKI